MLCSSVADWEGTDTRSSSCFCTGQTKCLYHSETCFCSPLAPKAHYFFPFFQEMMSSIWSTHISMRITRWTTWMPLQGSPTFFTSSLTTLVRFDASLQHCDPSCVCCFSTSTCSCCVWASLLHVWVMPKFRNSSVILIRCDAWFQGTEGGFIKSNQCLCSVCISRHTLLHISRTATWLKPQIKRKNVLLYSPGIQPVCSNPCSKRTLQSTDTPSWPQASTLLLLL